MPRCPTPSLGSTLQDASTYVSKLPGADMDLSSLRAWGSNGFPKERFLSMDLTRIWGTDISMRNTGPPGFPKRVAAGVCDTQGSLEPLLQFPGFQDFPCHGLRAVPGKHSEGKKCPLRPREYCQDGSKAGDKPCRGLGSVFLLFLFLLLCDPGD